MYEDQPIEIKYFKQLEQALTNIFSLHLVSLPSSLLQLKPSNLFDTMSIIRPTFVNTWTFAKGVFKKQTRQYNSGLSFGLEFLIKSKQLYLIKGVENTLKCVDCGSYYKTIHTCNVRRRDFYFQHINSQTNQWWKEISFFPIGSYTEVSRLYVTYDVETYTWHGQFGKQLVPFMLVYKIHGNDPTLVELACDLARKTGWSPWKDSTDVFFLLNPQRRAIGSQFKKFRDDLQRILTELLWNNVLEQNPHLKTDPLHEINAEQLAALKITGKPKFYELYIIGHNINGFDEIVLAAQTLNNKSDILPVFKIMRNFMPRNGKILFNDITFALPNPTYNKQPNFNRWEQGICSHHDMQWQYVKVMVRDTFALTHTSLQNAAKAYALPVEKGSCPYKAVNEFYMFGSYLKDADGFPAQQYWKDESEYRQSKLLWKKKECAYDIVEETLHYCVKDVLVTSELVKKLFASYQKFVAESVNLPLSNFNVFQRPTISSNSQAIFKQILYRAEQPKKKTCKHAILAPSEEMYEYVRQSIRGGRCYPTVLGIFTEPIYVYDICGMYASALTHPLPYGRPLNPVERNAAIQIWQVKLQNVKIMNYFDEELKPGIFTIDADPPDENMLDVLPPFCSKKGGRLCWTNESLRGEIATSIDIITLHNRGWKVTILTDDKTTVFPTWKCIAREYVQLNIQAKERADLEKNQTLRSIAKLLSNALYGSFATKLDNKLTVFSDQMDTSHVQGIAKGNYTVKATAFVETDNLSAEILPQLVVAYSPSKENADNEISETFCPFYSHENHVTYTYKPITFLETSDEDICLQTLEKNTPYITNLRYPSHIAAFVLAWTRAFTSEWAQILYSEDYGTPLDKRVLKAVYGDTDSLFLTERGRILMETKGKKHLKKYSSKLVFDPEMPELTWLAECETTCELCHQDGFSSESIFLAPKLYALKNVTCKTCGHVGKGKLRAKGHATNELSFEILNACYQCDVQQGSEKFQTSRTTLKRTLNTMQAAAHPFSITETTLTRTLRPWKDKTLHALDQNKLVPYSNSNPNPRNTEICWTELPWNTYTNFGTN